MAKSHLKVLAVLLGFTFAASAQAVRGNILDQEYAPSDPGLNQRVGHRRAQVFTAGATGLITSVEALISQTRPVGQLTVEIQTGVTEGPITSPMTILGSTSLPISSLPSASAGGTGPQFVSIDMASLNVSLTAGNQYALVLHTDQPPVGGVDHVQWLGGLVGEQPDYARGRALNFFPAGEYFDINGNSFFLPDRWSPNPQLNDYAFRTYAVPEPSTLALASLGVVLAATLVRARRESRRMRST